MERLERRYNGLLSAIEKMDRSIRRDKDELEFQNKRIANSDGQLEAQIRQAKIKMIEERVVSKKNKLGEMMKTKEELEHRMEQQKERDAQRAKQDQIKKAKEEAKDKIADEIKAAADARVDDEKIKKAADEIKTEKTPPKKEKKVLDEIGEAMEESLEDVIDTIKAIASVVGHEIKEAVEEIKNKVDTEEEE